MPLVDLKSVPFNEGGTDLVDESMAHRFQLEAIAHVYKREGALDALLADGPGRRKRAPKEPISPRRGREAARRS